MATYKRVLLKISGEALMGNQEFGVQQSSALLVANRIQELHAFGCEIGIVCGGGNIFRGIQQGPNLGLSRTPADQIGMLATLMNGIILNQALTHLGVHVRMMSALDCPSIAEHYQWERAMRYLKKGYIVLFVGGTGHPFFTTDTTAALRASEIRADLFLKATTRVDGIYDQDPRLYPNAVKYETTTFQTILEKKLGIIDLTAATLCMANRIPLRVFNFFAGSLIEAVSERSFGTLVTGD
jgi:uridylate kinase